MIWFWLGLIFSNFSLIGGGIPQQDSAREVLEKRNFPWYNPTRDDVQPLEYRPRSTARSLDREQVPEGIEKEPLDSNFRFRSGGGNMLSDIFNWWLYGLLGLLFIVIACMLAWAFLKVEASRKGSETSGGQGRSLAESVKLLPFDLNLQLGDFRQLAEQAYRRGEFRNAMIYLFSHLLVTLDHAHLIRLRKGKTNRQYLTELAGYQEVQSYFGQVMKPFEETFYGDLNLTASEFEPCWSRLPEFQQQIELLDRRIDS